MPLCVQVRRARPSERLALAVDVHRLAAREPNGADRFAEPPDALDDVLGRHALRRPPRDMLKRRREEASARIATGLLLWLVGLRSSWMSELE